MICPGLKKKQENITPKSPTTTLLQYLFPDLQTEKMNAIPIKTIS
jgi:hypothetical protein